MRRNFSPARTPVLLPVRPSVVVVRRDVGEVVEGHVVLGIVVVQDIIAQVHVDRIVVIIQFHVVVRRVLFCLQRRARPKIKTNISRLAFRNRDRDD